MVRKEKKEKNSIVCIYVANFTLHCKLINLILKKFLICMYFVGN